VLTNKKAGKTMIDSPTPEELWREQYYDEHPMIHKRIRSWDKQEEDDEREDVSDIGARKFSLGCQQRP
jgi:hypothetical protein